MCFCTRGRGIPDRHAGRRQAGDLGDEITTWATGSCALTDGSTSDGKEVAKYALVCHDQRIGSVCAHAVWKRGAGSKGIMDKIVKDLEGFGYAGIRGQEQAILGVQRSIAHTRKVQTGQWRGGERHPAVQGHVPHAQGRRGRRTISAGS